MTRGMVPFVHLRFRSAYSLLEGAILVKEAAELAQKYKMPALGIADSNNLFGALDFSETLAAAGVQPIMGAAISVRFSAPDLQTQVLKPDGEVVLLAQNPAGWRHLMAIASAAHLETAEAASPHVPWQTIADHAEGLILLSGGLGGAVNRALVMGRTDEAKAWLGQMHQVFQDRFYIELQRHGLPDEAQTEPELLTWAYAHHVPLVATNDPHFPTGDLYEAHDALLCIAEGSFVSQEDRRRLSREHFFKSPAAMAELFSDLPEAVDNTLEIAQRCAVRVRTHPPILPKFADDEIEALKALAHKGLEERLAIIPLAADKADYIKRLDWELDIIAGMGFSGYFLIVADFIQWAKTNGVPVGPGRGSGAGSLVAYALTITNLDPLRFGLLFERFLNPERVSMPDFDIDFCQERRERVIKYVCEKYGADKVAQIITFGALQARAVTRDVGRVLQLPLGLVDRLAKMIPNNPASPTTLAEALEIEPRLRLARREDAAVDKLFDIALQLEGLFRNASTHAAGVVIGDRPLVELCPLYKDPRSDLPATQFNMKWVEPAGLVKFDFLGLKTLTVLTRAQGYLKQQGIDVDFDLLPLDDEKTYELMTAGNTIGVFQLESTGMRDTLRKLRPGNIEEIIALISLYRPGPMENIDVYVDCKFGRRPPDMLHPTLEPILKETYGVIIYQEQVMQIAQVLSGYSLGEADLLRRAMGKKKKEEMDKQKVRFIKGASEKGVDPDQADRIFELVAKFAGYGFNKSHAAAYAVIAYQTGWLKANHPVEFIAASMSLDIQNTDKLAVFYQDAKRQEIEVLPPCVNRSDADFAVQDGKVLYALGAIKNVGLSAMRMVEQERKANGPFKDIFDFASRIDPRAVNKRAIENLARAGAFDGLHPNRAQIVANAELLLTIAASTQEAKTSSQVSLFGGEEAMPHPPLPATPPWSATDALDQELGAIGFYLSGHPLDAIAPMLHKRRVVFAANAIQMIKDGHSALRMAGVVRRRQERASASSGDKFAFVTLSDPTGEYEVLVPPECLSQTRHMLEVGEQVIITVRAQNRDGDARFFADGVSPLTEHITRNVKGLRITAHGTPEQVTPLMDVLKQQLPATTSGETASDRSAAGPPPSQKHGAAEGKKPGELILALDLPDGQSADIRLSTDFPLSPDLQNELRAHPSVLALEEL